MLLINELSFRLAALAIFITISLVSNLLLLFLLKSVCLGFLNVVFHYFLLFGAHDAVLLSEALVYEAGGVAAQPVLRFLL